MSSATGNNRRAPTRTSIGTAVGTIVAAFGRHYEIRLADGNLVTGFPKGKKSPYACGDHVDIELSADNQGQILRNAPRATLLYRSDEYRQKLIAANATQLIFVVATEPAFSDELLTRAVVAAEHEQMKVLIVLNKCDLQTSLAPARAMLAPYAALGYEVMELSAKQNADMLRPKLAGQCSVLVGQSGMGKSTLINALIPDAAAATREISIALDSGKHTTTYGRQYLTPEGDAIIDCPGVQEFGLAHLSFGEIENAFREFRQFLGQCRFRDCHHLNEPGCAIKGSVENALVTARRLELFTRITAAR